MVKGFFLTLIPKNYVNLFTLNLSLGNSSNPNVIVIWPKGLWGGFDDTYFPVEINDGGLKVYEVERRYVSLDMNQYFIRAKLAMFLISKINDTQRMSKLAYLGWCLSQQPFLMLKMIDDLSLLLKKSKQKDLHVHSVFYPFEFYPESKVCFRAAKANGFEALSAQHMKWTSQKLQNYVNNNLNIELPTLLYISKNQDRRVFLDTGIRVDDSKWVGRFDKLISRSVDLNYCRNFKFIQILSSGSPYDIFRSFEFAKRLKFKCPDDSYRIVMHPNTGKLVYYITSFLCYLNKIDLVLGFNGMLSKNKKIFTCGTSLYSSLKRSGVNVKDIGGKYSQF